MDEPLLTESTPTEYFKNLVEKAMLAQQVQAGNLTSYYLVDLLCRFVRPDQKIPFNDDSNEPLALRLGRAIETRGMEARARLRNLGDFSLFTAGCFQDSLYRKLVDVDYYASMGVYAYGMLASRHQDAFGEVYAELSAKFVAYTDVLSDVSESVDKPINILRAYEVYLRTHSERAFRKLRRIGVIPAEVGRRFLH